jgi:hypothetical protein
MQVRNEELGAKLRHEQIQHKGLQEKVAADLEPGRNVGQRLWTICAFDLTRGFR